MVKQKLNNKGFSFVELVIAVAILAVIMVSISTFMGSTTAVYTRTTKDNEVQIEAQNVYNTITNSIMQANKVIIMLYDDAGDAYANHDNYVSDNQPGVVGFDSTDGKLVTYDSTSKKYKPVKNFQIPIVNKAGQHGNYNLNGDGIKAFQYLKTLNGTDYEYKECPVRALFVEYQTKKADGTYGIANITYHVSKDGKLYMNRHDEDDATWTISGSDTYEGRIDFTENADNLLSSKLNYTDHINCGFKVVVDADANSIGIALDFKNATITYDSMGMTKIRNSNVLTKPQ